MHVCVGSEDCTCDYRAVCVFDLITRVVICHENDVEDIIVQNPKKQTFGYQRLSLPPCPPALRIHSADEASHANVFTSQAE